MNIETCKCVCVCVWPNWHVIVSTTSQVSAVVNNCPVSLVFGGPLSSLPSPSCSQCNCTTSHSYKLTSFHFFSLGFLDKEPHLEPQCENITKWNVWQSSFCWAEVQPWADLMPNAFYDPLLFTVYSYKWKGVTYVLSHVKTGFLEF